MPFTFFLRLSAISAGYFYRLDLLFSASFCGICVICGPIHYLCSMQHVKDDLQVRWLKLRIKLKERFGIKPDMDGVLFLIGIQELGAGPQEFTKEQKQDLMHIAVCTVLSASGYYSLSGYDDDGWPHFDQLKPLPGFIMTEQENFLKDHVLLYFQNQKFIE